MGATDLARGRAIRLKDGMTDMRRQSSTRRVGRAAIGGLLGVVVMLAGNAIDRVVHGGAVIDFVRFHVTTASFDFNWYVFNLADAAIVAGVGALLYESVRADHAAKVP